MLGALTNRTPMPGDALPRAARLHAAAGHERHSCGELSAPWLSAPFAINILLFTTEVKQCIPFLATLRLFLRTENYLLCKGRERTAIEKLLPSPERQLVRRAPGEEMGDVVSRLPVVVLRSKVVLNDRTSSRAVFCRKPTARVVERLRPCIGNESQQPVRKSPL